MNGSIVPLRWKDKEQSALTRADHDAMELLVTGQALSLMGARAEIILRDLRAQREQMTAMLADMRGRGSTGHPQIDETNANLITMIDFGVAQIDVFITRAQVFAAETAPPQPKRLGEPS